MSSSSCSHVGSESCEHVVFAIIGGGVSGLSVAEQLRRDGFSSERIVMFSCAGIDAEASVSREMEPFVSRPSLFFRLKFPTRERIEYGFRKPEQLERKHIELCPMTITRIRAEEHLIEAEEVHVDMDVEGRETVSRTTKAFSYDSLIVATGGIPRVLDENYFRRTTMDSGAVSSPENASVESMWSRLSNCLEEMHREMTISSSTLSVRRLDDENIPLFLKTCSSRVESLISSRKIINVLPVRNAEECVLLNRALIQGLKVVIIGSGTLCLDLLTHIDQGGLLERCNGDETFPPITVLSRCDRVGSSLLDAQSSQIITSALSSHRGINLVCDFDVQRIECSPIKSDVVEGGDAFFLATHVVSKTGVRIEGDLFIEAIGVSSDFKLAKEAGISIDLDVCGISVDENFQTSIPDVYSVGDCAAFVDPLLSALLDRPERVVWKNWTAAREQAQTCVRGFSLRARETTSNDPSKVPMPPNVPLPLVFNQHVVLFGHHVYCAGAYRIDECIHGTSLDGKLSVFTSSSTSDDGFHHYRKFIFISWDEIVDGLSQFSANLDENLINLCMQRPDDSFFLVGFLLLGPTGASNKPSEIFRRGNALVQQIRNLHPFSSEEMQNSVSMC